MAWNEIRDGKKVAPDSFCQKLCRSWTFPVHPHCLLLSLGPPAPATAPLATQCCPSPVGPANSIWQRCPLEAKLRVSQLCLAGQHSPCAEFTCSKELMGKKITPEAQGGDYLEVRGLTLMLTLRNTFSIYQVGWFCYSELPDTLFLCPYHDTFFCFSSSL